MKGGKNLFVGPKAEILRSKGNLTEVRDLGGKAMLPGFIIGPDQRVDAYTALQGVTTGPAWQLFEENRKGGIKEGLSSALRADVAVRAMRAF